jgi:hypothetical protein
MRVVWWIGVMRVSGVIGVRWREELWEEVDGDGKMGVASDGS